MTDPNRDVLVAACERAAAAREFHSDRVEATQQALDDAREAYMEAVRVDFKARVSLGLYDRATAPIAEQLDAEVLRVFGDGWVANIVQGLSGWHGVARTASHAVSVGDVPSMDTREAAETAMLATLRAMPTKAS